MSYPIITIPAGAREDTEQLGSKPKFWVLLDDGRWLFKEARANTGEDWAEKAAAKLAGYMVLDALIGNTDRHHENWGLLAQVRTAPKDLELSVAPSFDHASSLGRELLDERRAELLAAGRVGWYVGKGRGGIFRGPTNAMVFSAQASLIEILK